MAQSVFENLSLNLFDSQWRFFFKLVDYIHHVELETAYLCKRRETPAGDTVQYTDRATFVCEINEAEQCNSQFSDWFLVLLYQSYWCQPAVLWLSSALAVWLGEDRLQRARHCSLCWPTGHGRQAAAHHTCQEVWMSRWADVLTDLWRWEVKIAVQTCINKAPVYFQGKDVVIQGLCVFFVCFYFWYQVLIIIAPNITWLVDLCPVALTSDEPSHVDQLQQGEWGIRSIEGKRQLWEVFTSLFFYLLVLHLLKYWALYTIYPYYIYIYIY